MKKERRKTETTGQNIMSASATQGGHNKKVIDSTINRTLRFCIFAAASVLPHHLSVTICRDTSESMTLVVKNSLAF